MQDVKWFLNKEKFRLLTILLHTLCAFQMLLALGISVSNSFTIDITEQVQVESTWMETKLKWTSWFQSFTIQ